MSTASPTRMSGNLRSPTAEQSSSLVFTPSTPTRTLARPSTRSSTPRSSPLRPDLVAERWVSLQEPEPLRIRTIPLEPPRPSRILPGHPTRSMSRQAMSMSRVRYHVLSTRVPTPKAALSATPRSSFPRTESRVVSSRSTGRFILATRSSRAARLTSRLVMRSSSTVS